MIYTVTIFALVLILIFLCARILFYFQQRFSGFYRSNQKQIHIVESLYLDPKRRIVLVKCCGDEHALLLGPNNDIVIKGNINPVKQINKYPFAQHG
ncbi:MAG: flagellar biosynthetic protein FliO [Alphaproteobacteria bacterium]